MYTQSITLLSISLVLASTTTAQVITPLLDCGGGRAPPKTTVPGCPGYTGPAATTAAELSFPVPSDTPDDFSVPSFTDSDTEWETATPSLAVAPTHTSDIDELNTSLFPIGSSMPTSFLGFQASATANAETTTGTAFAVAFLPTSGTTVDTGDHVKEPTSTITANGAASSAPGITKISGVNGTSVVPTGSGSGNNSSSATGKHTTLSTSLTANATAAAPSGSGSGNATGKTNAGLRASGEVAGLKLGGALLLAVVVGMGVLV